jgi:hypothetical protein
VASKNPHAGTSSEVVTNPPTDFPGGSAQTGQIIRNFEETLKVLRDDSREIRGRVHTHFLVLIAAFATGFLVLAGMLITGYFRMDDRTTKLEDRLNTRGISNAKIETKLDDLLQRIPPAVTPVPRH